MISPKIGVAAVTVVTVFTLSARLHPGINSTPPSQMPTRDLGSQFEDLSDAEEQNRQQRKRQAELEEEAIEADDQHRRGREIRPADKAARGLLRRLP